MFYAIAYVPNGYRTFCPNCLGKSKNLESAKRKLESSPHKGVIQRYGAGIVWKKDYA